VVQRGSEAVTVALIAAAPPSAAALLGYLANRRSLRRSVGVRPGIPLSRVLERVETKVDRIDDKIDRLAEGQTAVRERVARMEGEWGEVGASAVSTELLDQMSEQTAVLKEWLRRLESSRSPRERPQ
jgi:hypothetical protein